MNKQSFASWSVSVWSVVAATLVVCALKFLYVTFGPIDLAPDEAHYWEWSRLLDWSYYSKPPLVAWLMALSTSMLGQSEVGVRFFAVTGFGTLSVLAWLLARRWQGAGAGWLTWGAFQLTPLFAAGAVLMTPDVPATVAWAAGLLVLSYVNWMKDGQWRLFVLLGVLLGLGGLAKYTVAFFYPLLLVFLVVDAQRRRWLLKPQVYVAGLISLVFTLPVFIWNAQHGWVSFLHVAGQAGGGGGFDGIESLGNFLGGQLGVVGLVTFLFMLAFWVWRGKVTAQSEVGRLIWWFSAPVMAFFIIKSLGSKVQPNWAVLAVFGGLVGTCCWVYAKPRALRMVFAIGLILSGAVTVIAHDTFILRHLGVSMGIKNDPLKPVFGWHQLGEGVGHYLEKLPADTVVLTTRYQTAGELAFYIPGQPRVLYVNPGYRRQNQYDLWEWPALEGRLALYVNEGKHLEQVIAKGYERCEPVGQVKATRDGVHLRAAHLFLCEGYKGIKRPRPERF